MAPRRGRLNRVRVSNQLGGAPPPRKRGREPGGPNEARAPHDHFLGVQSVWLLAFFMLPEVISLARLCGSELLGGH